MKLRARAAARPAIRLAALLAMLALPLFAAPPASAAGTQFYGIAQGTLDAQDYDGMQAAKVHTERFLLRWKSVEPTKGSFNWTDEDNFIGQLASHGIRPLPFLWGSPTWVGSGAIAQPPLNGAADQAAWKDFLTRAVSRYGPGGSYWGAPYHSKYGSSAVALPVQHWQIWNEPNLKKFFTPGASVAASAQKYASLVKISHDAIKAKDPKALIVLAGMPGFGDSKAWIFLDNIYAVAGIKNYFDVTALHPYARDINEFRTEVSMFRASMTNHGDGATPMWLTEWGWGSGPADQFGHNVGLTGQQKDALRLGQAGPSTAHRLERPADVLVLVARPRTGLLLRPPVQHLRHRWAAEVQPHPEARLHHLQELHDRDDTARGEHQLGANRPHRRLDPTFGFSSNEAGSTFQCHFDANPIKECTSPLTAASPLSNGTHTFFLKAIDAAGNESVVRSRAFTVDTVPPAPPQITATTPASPANNNNPKVIGSAAAGSTVRLYKTAGCTGAPVATGPATQFASPGLSATVADNTTTSFRARAADAAGNLSTCSSPAHLRRALGVAPDDDHRWAVRRPARGRAQATPSTPLAGGSHTFEVRATDKAKNTDSTPATRTFTVGPQPRIPGGSSSASRRCVRGSCLLRFPP